ncbi:hypothetical protein C882_4171 [Caenispirillum salinarum AK4]|uniref:Uncharacterized protein n=1 Tax=Caenispirillum salinarum AK4 TaxID=1238182 RepID=K9H1A0_9PROT|nr:hypothetical protein [Caenispirillum salinarum]EKV30834.1 hypothetical protein C882_4171 [Caenispirillum salinarum AK4]
MPRPTMRLLLASLALAVAPVSGALAEADVVLLPDGTTRVTVDARTCRKLDHRAAYRQAPGVQYQPGVDVRGNPVAPADVGGGYGIELPEEITIPITVDLAGAWRDRAAAGTVKAETLLGVVTIRDGLAFWNGEAIDAEAQADLREACRRLGVLQNAVEERKPDRDR